MKKNILNKFIVGLLALAVSACTFSAGFAAFGADSDFEDQLSRFPKSYRPYIEALHEKYPKWEFKALDTGLKWSDVIEAESSDNRNLVPKSSSDMLKSKAEADYNAETDTYYEKDAGWVCANTLAVSHFMDPRNFLDETNIFQFELLSFASSITVDVVEQVLDGTFMHEKEITYYDRDGEEHAIDKTYGEAIYGAGKAYNINPCYLASKIRNEVILSGGKGSGSVSGKYSGYAGYYNFYNIGAYDGATPIANGLKWAKTGTSYKRPWTDPLRSIEGGAQYLADKYISAGQDTGYLQKFNVNPKSDYSIYSHQYMTNVSGADSQGYTTYKTYTEYDLMPLKRVFSIPVFDGMPGVNEQADEFIFLDAYKNKGTVNVNSLNLRDTPQVSGEKVVSISKGTTVTVLSKCRNTSSYYNYFLNYPYWYEIKATVGSKSYTGYVCADYIDLTTKVKIKADVSSVKKQSTGKVNASSLNVRSSASTSGGKVVSIPSGTAVTVVSTVNTSSSQYPTWYKINFSYGGKSYTGYVYSGYITLDSLAPAKAVDITPALYCNSTEKPIFYSSNSNVAFVDSDGSIKAVGEGTAYISAATSKGGFDYIKISVSDDYDTLSSVKNLSYVSSGSGAEFKWSAVSDADGYEILVYKGSTPVAFKRTENTSVKIDKLSSSSSYTVKVRAYALSSKTRKNGGFTTLKNVTVTPAQVSGLELSGVFDEGYTVSWKKVSGATGYEVWLYNSSKNKYSLYKTTSSTSCKIRDREPGTVDKIKIRAYSGSDSDKFYGKYSSTFSAFTYHKMLSGLTQTGASASKIKLKWTKVSGAEKYVLYFENGGALKKIGETKKTSYTVSSLSAVTDYKITVMAIKDYNIRYAGKTVSAGTTAKAPSDLKVSSTDSYSITLTWTAKPGADYYRVYRYNEKTGSYKYLATVSKTKYKIESLSSCSGAKYAVRPGTYIEGKLFFGNYSSKVYASTGPAKVGGLKASLKSDGSCRLSWNKVSGTDVYYIYKSSSKNGTYEYIGKATSASYTVKKPGNKAYFKVRAVLKENSASFKGTSSSAVTF